MRHEEGGALIKAWLVRLKQVLYQADDLFDAVLTVEHQKQQMEGNKLLNQVRMIFSSSGPVRFNRKIACEIRFIREELDVIKSDMSGLNLREIATPEHLTTRLMNEREKASFVQADNVIGRETDKNNIIEMLLDPDFDGESLSVIPIVGFGGLGKTTLAQLVINDERIKQHFDLTKWACVPEINNQKEVLGKILMAFTDDGHQGLSLEQLQLRLKQSISNKRFLLVLDDIWDDSRNRWLDLKTLLELGEHGSKIIVTTRSDVVATIVGTIPQASKLGLLKEDESWDLFRRLAYRRGQEESNPELTRIGKSIVQTCANLPLAIKVVGSLLYSKQSENEWQLFRAQLSQARLMGDNDIMPVLRLSYDYLPSALKQCFAYCSLFPKDYEFDIAELVCLWMAQGYLEPSNDGFADLEEVGYQFFLELLRRNFFQDTEEGYGGLIRGCKMHDLVHDLAIHVAADESIFLDGSAALFTNRLLNRNVFPRDTLPKDLRSPCVARKTRSLFFQRRSFYKDTHIQATLEWVFSDFQSLRAFSLKEDELETIPKSVGRLRHLRYLNLSFSHITCLPYSITKLQNLQTLQLNSCSKLKTLPTFLTKLVNLRCLGIEYCPLTDMPAGFGKMRSIRELDEFVVGKSNGVDTLSNWNLRGKRKIKFHIWRRGTLSEVRRLNLKGNQQLTSLTNDLGFDGDKVTPPCGEVKLLLETFPLSPNLESLCIENYRGAAFPLKLVDELPKLVSVSIGDCNNCRVLPLFSHLPHLTEFGLSDCEGVEYIEDEDISGVDRESAYSAPYFPA